MGFELPISQQQRVEEFQRRHRVGLVTLLFTDIVGSTRLKQQDGEQKAVRLIQEHHAALRELLRQFPQAEEIETAGDSFLLVFGHPSDAVKFALAWQARLRSFTRETAHPLADRIGIHVGEVFIRQDEAQAKLFGAQVDTCARVMSLGLGDQILLTRFAFDNARSILRGEDIPGVGPLRWMNHGPYQLKGLDEPIDVCEVGEADAAVLEPPASSDKGRRHAALEGEPVLGWRPALEQAVPNTKWILEKKLGEGGFGEVWLGRHETLKERRVFKFCFRVDRVRSLKREVTLFRLLKERVGHHPNIVGIQEVFFDEPPFYIVMDYAEGQDLRTWCDAQGGADKVPLATRLEIVAQVADALQAAHEAGVIHRDIKPSNILVSNRRSEVGGQNAEASAPSSQLPASLVKLTDFGIGQVVSDEALAGMTRMGFTQTMIGPDSSSHTGTQLYMAPELMAGKPASTRSDIYSLGVVLFQLLVADLTRPLTTDWARRISDPSLRADLEKCFAGDPEERFASTRELAQNLRTLGERRHLSAVREKAVHRQRMLRKAGGTLLALAAVTLIVWLALEHGSSTNQNQLLVEESGTKNPQAADAYQRGKDFIHIEQSEVNFEEAVRCYSKAIDLDTNYALAYVGLAEACFWLDNNYRPRQGWNKKAVEAVNKALSLDANLADAYSLRGKIIFSPSENWDATNAVKDLRHALKVNPNALGAHWNLAFVYWHVGLLDEAIAQLEQHLKSKPMDNDALRLKGTLLMSQGKSKEASAFLDSVNDEAFQFPAAMVWHKGICLFYRGQTNEALSFVESQMAKLKLEQDPLVNSVLASFYAARGDANRAEAHLAIAKQGEKRFIHFHHSSQHIACAYALLHNYPEAMHWLKRAANEGFPCYPYFKTDPSLNNLRNDPDFQKFMNEQRKVWEHNKATLTKL